MENDNQYPPTPRGIDSTRSLMNYDHEENPYNLRDDLESSSFPTDAQMPLEPAQRLIEMVLLHGDAAALKQLDSYLINYMTVGMPIDRIAKELDVSVPMATKLMKEMKERWQRQIERLDVFDMMGESLAVFTRLREEGFKVLMNPETRNGHKLSAIEKIGDNELKKLKMFEVNRFYERKGYAPKENDDFEPTKKANYLVNIVQTVFGGGSLEDTEYYRDKRTIDVEVDKTDQKE